VTGAIYIVFGIPQPLVLALLTAVAALVPTVGTGLVWVPLSTSLFLIGQHTDATVVLVTGLLVAVLDNVLRPVLAKHAKLDLPIFAVLLTMIGGVVLFGAAGVLLGPLLMRLAVEALDIARDANLRRGAGIALVSSSSRRPSSG
jgi:predicted PurR-regulated permease PerM